MEFSSKENNGDEQEIFMTPTGTPEGYGQIRNKYSFSDIIITATTENCKDKNDDNLHSNHDFAPYRSI